MDAYFISFYQNLIIDCWHRYDGIAQDSLESDRLSFVDVLMFASCGYRSKQKLKSSRDKRSLYMLLTTLSRGLFTCLAQHVDRRIKEVYLHDHPTDKPAPSVRRDISMRRYAQVDPGTIYDLLQEAFRVGISLRQLIDSKRQDSVVGCAPSSTDLAA